MNVRHTLRAIMLALPMMGCATAGGARLSPLPHRFVISVGADSARTLLGSALSLEKLSLDGGQTSASGPMTSTFVVRKGGMGEAEVTVTMRLRSDAPSSQETSGVILDLDASIRDLRRMMVMSPEDARSPRLGRDPHPVQENDRDTLGKIRRLEDRLQQLGFERASAT